MRIVEFPDTLSSYLWVLFINYVTAMDSSRSEIERHLEMGKQFLSKGQFSDALTHYHAAVEHEPDNYQTRYRRATVYLAMGKSKSAMPDLDKVVELKPDFVAARVQRGNVLLKQGNVDAAQKDFEAVVSGDNSHAEASERLSGLTELRSYIYYANAAAENDDLDAAEYYYTKAIEVCQWDPDLYEKRAVVLEEKGEVQKSVADMRSVTRLVADSTEAFLKISLLLYQIGDTEESLSQIRECLKLNPDHKECFVHYKRVKKLVKMQQSLTEAVQGSQWMRCLEKAQEILKFETGVDAVRNDVFRFTCKCHMKAGHTQEAIDECTEALEISDENDADLLCDRAEAFILNEQFEEAIDDFQKAVQINHDSRRAQEGLNRAKKLHKQAQRKDYYKILDVKRNANKREITKAYRKLAQKWHPDNFSDEKEKKRAEAKFIDIAAAKEVLTDKEKREMFDRGEDPLDPEQQRGGHGHPFYGGFNPFGGQGGPFTFKFHFG